MPSARQYLAARRRMSALEARLDATLDELSLARAAGAENVKTLRLRAEILAREVRIEVEVVNEVAGEFWEEKRQSQARAAEYELMIGSWPLGILDLLATHLRPWADLMARVSARFAPPDSAVSQYQIESGVLLRADREIGRYG